MRALLLNVRLCSALQTFLFTPPTAEELELQRSAAVSQQEAVAMLTQQDSIIAAALDQYQTIESQKENVNPSLQDEVSKFTFVRYQSNGRMLFRTEHDFVVLYPNGTSENTFNPDIEVLQRNGLKFIRTLHQTDYFRIYTCINDYGETVAVKMGKWDRLHEDDDGKLISSWNKCQNKVLREHALSELVFQYAKDNAVDLEAANMCFQRTFLKQDNCHDCTNAYMLVTNLDDDSGYKEVTYIREQEDKTLFSCNTIKKDDHMPILISDTGEIEILTGEEIEFPILERNGYEILEELGTGTFGRVYSCIRESDGRKVAVKIARWDGHNSWTAGQWELHNEQQCNDYIWVKAGLAKELEKAARWLQRTNMKTDEVTGSYLLESDLYPIDLMVYFRDTFALQSAEVQCYQLLHFAKELFLAVSMLWSLGVESRDLRAENVVISDEGALSIKLIDMSVIVFDGESPIAGHTPYLGNPAANFRAPDYGTTVEVGESKIVGMDYRKTYFAIGCILAAPLLKSKWLFMEQPTWESIRSTLAFVYAKKKIYEHCPYWTPLMKIIASLLGPVQVRGKAVQILRQCFTNTEKDNATTPIGLKPTPLTFATNEKKSSLPPKKRYTENDPDLRRSKRTRLESKFHGGNEDWSS